VSLGRTRLLLALGVGLVTAIATGWFVHRWSDEGTKRIMERARGDLHAQVAQIAATINVDHLPNDQIDAWLVNTDTGEVKLLGNSQLEPPLTTVAKQAVGDGGGTAYADFSQDGEDYRLYGQALAGTKQVVLATTALGAAHAKADSLQLRIWLEAAGAVLAAMLVAWLIAGRAIRPMRRLLDQQRNFLANAAHELRTPIAVIQASASQALARPRTPETYVQTLAEIRSAAERAGTGVGEMLDLARLDAGQAVPRRAPLRIDLLLEEVAAGVHTTSAVTVSPSEALVVDADYSLLRQAIDNVVQNAARRAPHVALSVTAVGKDAVVEISDDGPGFAPDLLPRVFDRYVRGDNRADGAGTGLGLAIVRSIVEAHGGRAEASNNPDKGALIRITLPRSRT
jgi:signal transduction histidine kinase